MIYSAVIILSLFNLSRINEAFFFQHPVYLLMKSLYASKPVNKQCDS